MFFYGDFLLLIVLLRKHLSFSLFDGKMFLRKNPQRTKLPDLLIKIRCQFVFAQVNWKVIYEQEANGGILINNLSSSE